MPTPYKASLSRRYEGNLTMKNENKYDLENVELDQEKSIEINEEEMKSIAGGGAGYYTQNNPRPWMGCTNEHAN